MCARTSSLPLQSQEAQTIVFNRAEQLLVALNNGEDFGAAGEAAGATVSAPTLMGRQDPAKRPGRPGADLHGEKPTQGAPVRLASTTRGRHHGLQSRRGAAGSPGVDSACRSRCRQARAGRAGRFFGLPGVSSRRSTTRLTSSSVRTHWPRKTCSSKLIPNL